MNRFAFSSAVVFVFCALGLASAQGAPWVSTGGPVGGLGYDVRIHPTSKQIMFVTDNYAGVIKSTDRGKSWRPANTGISVRGGPSGDAYTIFSLTIDQNDPNIVWAGTNGDGGAFGVFKSTDGGGTWALKNTGISDGGFGIVFRGFTVQTGNSSVVYAQAELPTAVQGREFNRTTGRVYKSTDGGGSWSLIWSGANLARYLIVDPTDAATLYISTGIFDREAMNSDCAAGILGAGGVGVLKSIDGGANWTAINAGLTDLYVGALRMHPSNPQILFAATGNNACSGGHDGNIVSGLFRTSNGGTSWTKVISNDIFTAVAFSPSSPNVVYAGSARAFYRSTDGGTTWASFSKQSGSEWGPAGIRAGVPIDVVIDPDDANILYANNYGGGVFASTDGARSWKVWSRGYSGAELHAVAVPDTRTAAVYAIGRSGPFVSPNYGLDWVGIGNGDANFPEWYAIAAQPGSPDVVLISDEHQGWMLRSANGGSSFSRVFRQPNADASMSSRRQGFKTIAFAPSSPSVVYAGVAKDRGSVDSSAPVGRVFYRSTDAGVSFTSPGQDLDGKNVHRLVVDRSNARLLWAATSGGIYKSVDQGGTWTLLGLAGKDVLTLAVSPTDASLLIASVRDLGIFVSTDGGASWPGGPFNQGLANANPSVLALVFEPAGAVIYAGDFYSGVYRSMDGGKSWAGFPDAGMTGLRMRSIKDLALANGVLYAATQGGGMFRNGGPAIIPTPVDGDFGSVIVGASSAPLTFTLYNTGVASRALTGRSVGGANAAEFRVQNDGCAALLAPSASCTFDVVFSPSAAGIRTAALNAGSDDPFGASYPIVLRGSAPTPPVDAAPDAGVVDAAVRPDAGAPPDGGADVAAADASGAGGLGGSGGAGGAGGSAGGGGSGGSARSKSGCNCSFGRSESSGAPGWLLVIGAFAVVLARRRSVR